MTLTKTVTNILSKRVTDEEAKQFAQNNKIIAEFMGLEITKDKVIVPEMFQVEEHPFYLLKWIDDFRELDNLPPNSLNNLHFHSDWNWLMEVVEKIESISFEEDNFINVTIGCGFDCTIQDAHGKLFKLSTWEHTKIKTVYNTCLEFIKYYNEQTR